MRRRIGAAAGWIALFGWAAASQPALAGSPFSGLHSPLTPPSGLGVPRLACTAVSLAGGAPSGTSAGSCTSSFANAAFSDLDGRFALSTSGALTIIGMAPGAGPLSAHIRAQDATNANADEITLSIPITTSSAGTFVFASNERALSGLTWTSANYIWTAAGTLTMNCTVPVTTAGVSEALQLLDVSGLQWDTVATCTSTGPGSPAVPITADTPSRILIISATGSVESDGLTTSVSETSP